MGSRTRTFSSGSCLDSWEASCSPLEPFLSSSGLPRSRTQARVPSSQALRSCPGSPWSFFPGRFSTPSSTVRSPFTSLCAAASGCTRSAFFSCGSLCSGPTTSARSSSASWSSGRFLSLPVLVPASKL
eukprot:Amastigsp_a509852_12.p3 type:complete len:128 gc:universal Amastigsp_a509852_12:251-634(+)